MYNRFFVIYKLAVYQIPLPCGKQYVGQTSHRPNDRLQEHRNNVNKGCDRGLALHCSTCTCDPFVTPSPREKLRRLIIEAYSLCKHPISHLNRKRCVISTCHISALDYATICSAVNIFLGMISKNYKKQKAHCLYE